MPVLVPLLMLRVVPVLARVRAPVLVPVPVLVLVPVLQVQGPWWECDRQYHSWLA